MLKGLRWPFLALVLASIVMALALITQPEETPQAAQAAPTATPAPADASPQPSPQPTLDTQPLPPNPTPVPPESILVEALIGRISKLNPLLATYNPVDRDITSLIFEGLTASNEYGEIVPDLAESWTISRDGLQYIVALRQDILWQDGIPFTAEDVAFTFDLLSNPLFPGAPELHEFWRTVEVEALDQFLVRFRLTQPLASFLDQLRIGIVPAHALRGAPVEELGQHRFNLAPIGTGPYQIETLTASEGEIDGIQLRAAPVYRQRPEGVEGFALDRIVFRTFPNFQAALDAYNAGEVNSIGRVPPARQEQAQQVPGLSLYTAIEPHVGVLIYNWQRESVWFLRNQRVRLALAHAVDRAALVATHLGGRAILADSPLLPNSWAYRPGDWPAYDLAQAQAVLETARSVLDSPPTPPESEAEPAAGEAAADAAPEGSSEGEPPAEGADEPPPEAAAEDAPAPEGESQPPAEGEGEPPAEPAEEATEELPAPEAPPVLAITILTPDDPALEALAQDVAASWSQLGFTTAVETVDAATLQSRLDSGDFDAALVELSFEPNADPDPYVFWHQGQAEDGQNFGGMDDRRVSEALEAARREPYGINRVAHYERFQELFAERAPAIVLYYPLYIYATDARLEGVQIAFMSAPSDRFRTVQDWRFSG